MRKAIYTVCLDGYDYFPRPAKKNPSWDKIVFTDQKMHEAVEAKWDRVIYIDPTDRPDIKSRDIKWRSHIHLPEYSLVVYVDANMLIKKSLPEMPFRVEHEKRFSIREEADALIRLAHRCTPESIELQLKYYEEQGFKDDQGLYYGGFFSRYHNQKENRVGEMVYHHVQNFTSRDQLSFPFCSWVVGYSPENIVNKQFFKSHLTLRHHKKKHPIMGKL